jgi:TPP-dependent pyruvate/acetoin dehydrogenase alpha subunit
MIGGLNDEQCLDIYKRMKLIRRFEENAFTLGEGGEIFGALHLYIGEEAVGVGVCHALDKSDVITSTHRGHGHIIAKGGEVKYMFCELMGRENGYNRGKGGSMHIAEPELGIFGANGIVGAGVPIAVGIALQSKLKKKKQVIASFFGDGALGTGAVHEAMNMAAIWRLPILFVCENNQYAVSTSIKDMCLLENPGERANAYGFGGVTVDGMNVADVYEAAKTAVEKARNGDGPTFIECKTYRYRDHSIGAEKLRLTYRTEKEIENWKAKCPINNWGKKLLQTKTCEKADLLRIDQDIENIINEGIEFARSSSLPEPEDALNDMYAAGYRGIPDKGWIELNS